jgi:nitrite reductase/ring-hydroxylating ferredoxin subunit
MKLLAAAVDVPEGGALAVDEVLLTRSGGAVFAFRNVCSHAGFALSRADGVVIVQERRYIVCPVHGASFDMRSGACAGGPCNGEGLTPIAVTERDGLIYAAV